ncbi:aminoglycoside phosphotransferase [Photobacterium proteolyticum]|uniref:Aminoglycoside phosphotransferase n=1 Tax=Photobacterium proteolyticum TaxID=1903952 RepID=A0A1Q9GZB5_9GAMM|nr:aminoglycoside phosphotransferase family protein [Photobacterium proteolyticum]OLQ80563.1 aminoglycoside phosphotransferase [Photobacterium proteolyticum]
MAAEPVQRRLQFVLDVYEKYPNDNVTLCYFGMANEVFIVPTKDGKFVLKNCFKSNTHELVSNEVALIDHLNRNGCPTPAIVADKTGFPFVEFDGSYYVMTEYVPDMTYNWESEIPEKAYRETVHALADFHQATRSFKEPYPGLRIQFLDMVACKRWLTNLYVQIEASDKSRNSVKKMSRLLPKLIALASRLEDELATHDLSVLSKCYIHGDLHCFNLFYDQDVSYTGVIDFDFSRYDHRLADIYWTSRILFFSEMRKRYSREELNSDDFEVPQDVAEQVLFDNWRMIITEYRKIAELTAEELSYIYLFVEAVPLYIVRFFELTNSEEECLEHIEWFEWELSRLEKDRQVLQRVIKRVLNDLDSK